MKKLLVVSCFGTVLLGLSQIVISSSNPTGEDEVEKLRAELKETRAELQKAQDEIRRLHLETHRKIAAKEQEIQNVHVKANEIAQREQTARLALNVFNAKVQTILCDGLKDPQSPVRRWCAESSGKLGGNVRGAVNELVRALKDEDLTVCKAAAEALKKIDPEAAANAGIK